MAIAIGMNTAFWRVTTLLITADIIMSRLLRRVFTLRPDTIIIATTTVVTCRLITIDTTDDTNLGPSCHFGGIFVIGSQFGMSSLYYK